MTLQEQIDAFLRGSPHAVVGASRDRSKYGNKVLRAYLQQGRTVYPINPHADEVEGIAAYPDLSSLPEPMQGISIITQPEVTELVIAEAERLGISHIWMQPGSESEAALMQAQAFDMNVIAGGPCALVVLGYHEI